jgi:phosphohistidine phosphatase
MSKLVGLLRHAKSSWKDAALAEFDRPLNKRGRASALAMGEEMRRLGISFDRVVASPARRVTETLDLVQEGFGGPLPVRFEPRVYEAPLQALLDIIRETDEAAESLLIVGHNPAFARLAIYLTRADDPRYLTVAAHYPTGAFLMNELPVSYWQDVGPGSGSVLQFIKPRGICEPS